MRTRIAASEIVPEGRFVASFKMLPLAVALLEASRSRSALRYPYAKGRLAGCEENMKT
jgi:hypothetical protein